MPGEDSNYKLIYFSSRGLAESIRLILHYKEIPFEDFRLKFEDRQTIWPQMKPKMPFGTVPVLEFVHCDGDTCEQVQLGQSHTICRYLGKKYGLAGKTELEQAKVDELGEWFKDIWRDYLPYFMVAAGFRDDDKAKLRAEIFVPLFEQRFLPILTGKLKESTSPYILSFGLTWVDFVFAEICTTMNNLEGGELFAEHKELAEYTKRVYAANEAVKKYVENRPILEF